MSGQPGAVGACAFHPDPADRAIAAQPGEQLSVAARDGWELPITELAAESVEYRRMVGLAVGVDTADDGARRGGHAGHRRTSSARTGWVGTLRSGGTDKTVMGASRTGSYEVTPPGRSRASDAAQQADRSRQGQHNRVSLTEGQARQPASRTSSLSYVHSDSVCEGLAELIGGVHGGGSAIGQTDYRTDVRRMIRSA